MLTQEAALRPSESRARKLGLPEQFIRAYQKYGIKELYDWQASILNDRGVLDGRKSLVYTAPTSGGKTLVAEILMIRRLLDAGADSKALYVLPFKAVAADKAAYFREVRPSQLCVKIFPLYACCKNISLPSYPTDV